MPGIYAAFDVFPSSKGASTHIAQFAKTLFEFTGGGTLCALAGNFLPQEQTEGNTTIKRLRLRKAGYLQRAEAFSAFVQSQANQLSKLEVAHFRDIWGGLPLLHPKRKYATVFEVNGLPSIELPYRYPYLSQDFINKLKAREIFCLKESDVIVTPSQVTANYLASSGIDENKITIIQNGAVIPESYPKPTHLPQKYIMYFGALQPWQGVDVLLKAFAGLQDYEDLYLLICNAGSKRMAKPYKKLAEKLEIADHVIWEQQLDQLDVWARLQHATVSVAPLKENSRNVTQGCSPLKILESLACGTPVVATDLPVVKELMQEGIHGKLIPAERPAMLSRAIRFLLDYPEVLDKMRQDAIPHINNHFLWENKNKSLKAVYRKLL